jgi:hypothetical protein
VGGCGICLPTLFVFKADLELLSSELGVIERILRARSKRG